MFAPLSGKLKMKMEIDQSKAKADEDRKRVLHDIKVQEASAKANQSLLYKARDQAIKEAQKVADTGVKSPVPPLSMRQAEMPTAELPDGDDQFALLDGKTPIGVKSGEAIIPEPAAQDPKYKPLIAQMVAEGRQGNSEGTTEILPPGYSKGTVRVSKMPQRKMLTTSDLLPKIPTIGSRSRNMRGYADGTTAIGYGTDEQMREAAVIDPNQNIGWTAEDEARVLAEDTKELAREIERSSSAEFPGKDKPPTSLGWTAGDSPKSVLRDYASGIAQTQPEGSWGEVPPVNPLVGTTGRASVMRTLAPVPELKDTTNRASVMRATEVPVSSIEQERQANAGVPLKPLITSDVNEGRVPMAPSDTSNYDEVNRLLARTSQEKAPEAAALVEQAKQIKNPSEQKNFLEKAIAGLFGDTGLFTPRDLARFAVVSAGGMLTGGSVGGSLRYAGLDTLKQVDERESNQYLDNRAASVKNQAMLTELVKKGYSANKAEKYLESQNPADLGAPAIQWERTSANPRNVTPEVGANQGDLVELVEMKDKYSGNVKEMAAYKGKLYEVADLQNYLTGKRSKPVSLVPYNQSTSREGVAEKYKIYGDDVAKDFDEFIKKNLSKDKDGNYKGAQSFPDSGSVAQQASKYLKERSVDLSDPDMQIETKGVINNAKQEMLRDHESRPREKITSIVPYLENARIKQKTGNLDEGLFFDGSNKPMSVPKRMELYQLAKISTGGKTPEEQDAAAAKVLSTLADVWSNKANQARLRNEFRASENNSAFFNFAMSKLKPEQKK